MFTDEILESDIGIFRDTIVLVGNSNGFTSKRTLDAKGMTAIPGLIDTHLHIESTMMTPTNFAAAVLPFGTTTVCADPHEIVNVLGKEGLRMMIKNAQGLPMKVLFFAPTCVPESDAVSSGAEITPEDIEETLGWKGVCGLGEVMDTGALLSCDEKVLRILEIGRERQAVIDGHCPLLSGKELAAYVASGPEADHENFDARLAVDKLRTGLYLKLRGPDILDVRSFASQLCKMPKLDRLLFVTDDIMPDRLQAFGHLNNVCRAAIKEGMDPIEVVKSATIRAATHMRMSSLGAVSPGKTADIVLVSSLGDMEPRVVISKGKVVARGGKLVTRIAPKTFDREASGTIYIRKLSKEDFLLPDLVDGEYSVRCIDFSPFRDLDLNNAGKQFLEMVLTKISIAKVDIAKRRVETEGVSTVLVFERHRGSGRRSFGFARNLMASGALASTVSHDAHNLLVVGREPDDMHLAASELLRSRGGICVVKDKKVLARIALPIAGLMCEDKLDSIATKMSRLRQSFRSIQMLDHPYMPIPFLLTLSVIPHGRITDKGLYDVDERKFLDPVIGQAKKKTHL